jgi:hypothetical protein
VRAAIRRIGECVGHLTAGPTVRQGHQFGHAVVASRGVAAVNGNRLPADERRVTRDQICRGGRDLLRTAQPGRACSRTVFSRASAMKGSDSTDASSGVLTNPEQIALQRIPIGP